MNRRRWVIRGVVGGLGWVLLGATSALAAAIPPTVPATLMLSADTSVAVSLYQLDSALPTAVTPQSPSRCTSTGTPYYRDVTDCWLPEWNPTDGGKSVFVVVNGSADAPTLVPPLAPAPAFPLGAGTPNPYLTALTTSAYPGRCTNLGTDTGPDFQLAGSATVLPTSTTTSVTGYELIPGDCGGIAVVGVGARKFLFPKDGTASVAANGLPEVWETLHGGPLDPGADIDTGPAATSTCCDGIATIDEYRGFIVSGKQVRTDPKQKDLFVHLVNPADSSGGVFVTSPRCGASCYGGGTTTYPAPAAPSATLTVPAAAATPGARAAFTASAGAFSTAHVRGELIGNAGGRARIVAVTGPTSATAEITQAFTPGSLAPGAWRASESVFALVYALVAPERLHLLGHTPGATNLRTDEWVDNFVSLVPAQTLSITDTATDRTVNANRLYGPPQKGVRIMEGLNTSSSSVLGWSFGKSSPNEAGNVVVFAQRVINYLEGLMVGATTLRYSTASLVNGAWTWSTPIPAPDGDPAVAQDGVATNPGVRNFILSRAFQFYTGHEIHHSLDLTPEVQGTNRTTYGYHFAPGTGDCLDQAITVTSKSGTVTFNIPSGCGTVDQAQFVIP
jgi:hypothetical protein